MLNIGPTPPQKAPGKLLNPKRLGDGAGTSDRDHTGKAPLGGGILRLRPFGLIGHKGVLAVFRLS